MMGVSGIALFLVSGSMYSPLFFDPPAPDLFSPSGVAVQLGLAPQSLAGAGVTGESAETLLTSLIAAEQDRLALRTLLEAVDGASTPQTRQTAQTALNTAMEELRADLVGTLFPQCDNGARAIAIGQRESIPADLAAVVCAGGSSSNASHVKQLLIAERRASRMGRTLSEPITFELAALRGHETAIAVRALLASNLGDIEEAFGSAWTFE